MFDVSVKLSKYDYEWLKQTVYKLKIVRLWISFVLGTVSTYQINYISSTVCQIPFLRNYIWTKWIV
jgi:hypothetical protein